MKRVVKLGLLETQTFVVMPDHLHWLITLKQANLATVMQHFKGLSAFLINRYRKTSGIPVWQPGFHDHALRKEEDIKALARYIIANPLRAGLVDNIGDYPLWDAVWL